MFTTLFITRRDGAKLLKKYKQPNQAVSYFTFKSEGETVVVQMTENGFRLEFNKYLSILPQSLTDLEIMPERAELYRPSNAITRALPGHYGDDSDGCSATVEQVLIHNEKESRSVFVHNIRVSGPTLEAVQQYNSQLSSGALNERIVHSFA